ncbi:hypothetical protein PUR57_07075 [Streptomyces sp. JV176]|uniref:hypothetical protein n=1 Tax=Streptomyces sp. JV176 TaxID=858630 RepID=UPI002E79854E|nr:hypothetical protein [Streptomyces sp. JV176]MEE1798439.1 hypothetical protein [Streptomyces sp. JV176]
MIVLGGGGVTGIAREIGVRPARWRPTWIRPNPYDPARRSSVTHAVRPAALRTERDEDAAFRRSEE